MNRLIVVICIAVILLPSCSNRKVLLLPTKEIEFNHVVLDTVHSVITEIEAIGQKNLYVHDSILFVDTYDKNAHLKLFSLNDYKPLANLCAQGRARNEFNDPWSVNEQFVGKGENTGLFMYDNYSTIKVINIAKSIEKGVTIVDSSMLAPVICKRGNSLLIPSRNIWFNQYNVSYNDPRDGIFFPQRFTITDGETETDLKIFSRLMTLPEGSNYPFFLYNCKMALKPDESKVVIAYGYMPYMFIIDVETRTGFALHEKGRVSFDDVYPDEDRTDIDICYGDIRLTDDYIIAVCYDGKQNDYGKDKSKMPVVRVFDWEGNILQAFTLDRTLNSMGYDERNKKLYGLDLRYEEIYEFDISKYIK